MISSDEVYHNLCSAQYVMVELPKIANKFEEKTIEGSRVTPKTAGIESTCEHERL